MNRLLLLTLLAGCSAVPLQRFTSPTGAPETVLVWVGRGECERLENGAWVRRPEFDYDFSVEQRRFGDRWYSIKSMRREAAAYDGSAGPREQTMFFELTYAPDERALRSTAHTTLGDGTGHADLAFREAQLELKANVSSLAPFDRYRIVQHYDYEGGALEETVSLDKGDAPWVRNREHARLFAATRFSTPPTTWSR